MTLACSLSIKRVTLFTPIPIGHLINSSVLLLLSVSLFVSVVVCLGVFCLTAAFFLSYNNYIFNFQIQFKKI